MVGGMHGRRGDSRLVRCAAEERNEVRILGDILLAMNSNRCVQQLLLMEAACRPSEVVLRIFQNTCTAYAFWAYIPSRTACR